MLVVLEAAGLLVDRLATEWHLAPETTQARFTDRRPVRRRPRLWQALRRDVSRIVAWFRRAEERRELIAVLASKDDRLLADIGITRSQIREVADAAVRRGPQHPSRLISPTARVSHDAVAVEAVTNDNRPRIAA
jgi:uncharacterized protein YjiS (DUF1127 family)